MMTCVLACRMLENEVKAAMAAAGLDYPVFWHSGLLHNSPKRLHGALAESLYELRDYDRVILTYGLCGRAVEGLSSVGQQLILPRVDDCISMLLGSQEKRDELGRTGSFFATGTWMTGERSLGAEYERTLARYGERVGQQIIRAMFAHYNQLILLDTGCCSLQEVLPEVRRVGALLELNTAVIPGVLDYLTELLTGPWPPEKFLVVEPGETVAGERLRKGRTTL